jgi:DUF4097 and DUF4098 domain-containing protein YvlB
MYSVILVGMLAMSPMLAQEKTDTVVPVDRNTRLELENTNGSVLVHVWDRMEVKISAQHSSRERIEIRNSLLRLHIEANEDFDDEDDSGRPRHRTGGSRSRIVDYEITVPATMPVSVSGQNADVTIEGVKGEVSVETVQGDVEVTGGTGNISLESVNGGLTLKGARGHVSLHSVNESIVASDIVGDMTVEAVSGDITLERIQADRIDATTVSGDIEYDGTIRDAGSYSFTTHSGDVRLAIAESSNGTFSVATFSGDFQAGFPVHLNDTRQKSKRFNFTLGNGSARVELESFSGDIEIVKPGELR